MNPSKDQNIIYSTETRKSDFYTYLSIEDLAALSEQNKLDVIRCRTVGILHSEHGKYYLSDILESQDKKCQIRVSIIYLKTQLPSTIIPYTIQIFGMLEWHNRPVIFATIIQTLSTAMAIRMKNALSGVSNIHIAKEITKTDTHEQNLT